MMLSQSSLDTWRYWFTSETVEGLSLALEGIHDKACSVHAHARCGVLGDRVIWMTDDFLEEDTEHTAGLLLVDVDETRDTLVTVKKARRRMAGLVMPWMLSRRTLR